jgi:DNA-binding transcriptional ArsR family regulator
MRPFINITKALSDTGRVRALMFLRHEELCVCQIIDMLQLSPSTVSKHMSILVQAGLVETRKDGRWHYYRWVGKNAAEHVRAALKWMVELLEHTQEIEQDDRRRSEMVAKDPQDLCCYYTNGKCSSSVRSRTVSQADALVVHSVAAQEEKES